MGNEIDMKVRLDRLEKSTRKIRMNRLTIKPATAYKPFPLDAPVPGEFVRQIKPFSSVCFMQYFFHKDGGICPESETVREPWKS